MVKSKTSSSDSSISSGDTQALINTENHTASGGNNNDNNSTSWEYKDPKRFLALAAFSLIAFTTAMLWITFAPIAEPVRHYFGLSTNQINLLSSIFMIGFICGAPPVSAWQDQLGVKMSLVVAGALNVLSCVMRMFPATVYNHNFGWLLSSQIVGTMAQLFTLSLPSVLASTWFPPQERTKATAVATLLNAFGAAGGLFMPPLIVSGDHEGKKDFLILFSIQLVVSFIGLVLSIMVPTLPLHPPSPSSPQVTKERRNQQTLKKTKEPSFDDDRWKACVAEVKEFALSTWRLIRGNRSFVFLTVAFAVSIGNFWAMSSVLAQVLLPFGLSEQFSGIIGAVSLVCGLLLSAFIGKYCDRTRQYKRPLILLVLLGTLSCGALLVFMYVATPGSTAMKIGAALSCIFAGCFQNSTLPVAFEYATELAFPEREMIPGTMLMIGGNAIALTGVSIGSSLMNSDTEATTHQARNVVWLIFGLGCMGTMMAFLPKHDLKRLAYEKQHMEGTGGGVPLHGDGGDGGGEDGSNSSLRSLQVMKKSSSPTVLVAAAPGENRSYNATS